MPRRRRSRSRPNPNRAPQAKKPRATNLAALTHHGNEWMTAGTIPVVRGVDGEWLMLATIATKNGVWTLSPLKSKRNAGETTPMQTALRGFNEGASGAFKTLTEADLDERKWVYSANGKMIFYWFDAGSTALLDEFATDVVWVPAVACGGRTVADSFTFSIAARKVSEAIDERAVAVAYAGFASAC